MRTTLRTTGRLYLLGGVWLLVMLTVAAVSTAPMGSLYSTVSLDDPLFRTLGTMTLAITAAGLVTAPLWKRSGLARRSPGPLAIRRSVESDRGTAGVNATR